MGDLALRRCDCSFCQKHGCRYTSDPAGKLTVDISQKNQITRYHFGHKTADFILCTNCGALPLITSDIEGKTYAVLNANCLDKIDQLQDKGPENSFGAEVKQDRLTRRQKNWIGTVVFRA